MGSRWGHSQEYRGQAQVQEYTSTCIVNNTVQYSTVLYNTVQYNKVQ